MPIVLTSFISITVVYMEKKKENCNPETSFVVVLFIDPTYISLKKNKNKNKNKTI